MIAALLSLAVWIAPAQTGELRARGTCDPAEVAVGEPFRLVLEIVHDPEDDVRSLLEAPIELGGSWVLLGRELEPTASDAADPARRVSRAVLTIASLEPGARSLAAELSAAFHDPRLAAFDAAAAHVDVASVLAEGEDAPRPPRGLPEDFGASSAGAKIRLLPWILAAAGVVLLSALYVVRRELARRRSAVRPEDPRETLEAIGAGHGAPDGALRERAYELSRFLRATVDRRLGRARAGLTDEEWLAAVEASGAVAPELLAELRAFAARTEELKYAGVEPSEWAHGELLASARRALELLLAAPPPAPIEREEQAA